jgi:16S rRNA A1518/A1519 N6-dimethyltransferase RsmA/KsgA/DIM1 with predicted DNA glycosylase/AP lyase activity
MWVQLIIMGTIEICLVAFAIFFVTQFFNMLFRGFAPYLSTRSEVINKIIDEIKINDGAKIYELGCGKAGFLKAFEDKFPKAVLIGVEYSFWPYFVAKLQLSLSHSRIKIIKRNMFKINLSDASLVYCYLNEKMMAALEKKFSEECKPGTQIISYTFKMPTKQATKVIEINKNSKVYFYSI